MEKLKQNQKKIPEIKALLKKKIENAFDGMITRMDMAGKRVNEHEDMSKETSQIENRINIKKPTERQVICKLQKNKDQEKSLKEAKRKKHLNY